MTAFKAEHTPIEGYTLQAISRLKILPKLMIPYMRLLRPFYGYSAMIVKTKLQQAKRIFDSFAMCLMLAFVALYEGQVNPKIRAL